MQTYIPVGRVVIERDDPRAVLPARAHAGDVGYDLAACEACVIPPRGRALVDTGLRVCVDAGALSAPGLACHPEIVGRSGLALRGVDVAAGQIDLGFRGRVRVCLVNHGAEPFAVANGDRIAQLKFVVVALPAIVEAACGASADGRGEHGRAMNVMYRDIRIVHEDAHSLDCTTNIVAESSYTNWIIHQSVGRHARVLGFAPAQQKCISLAFARVAPGTAHRKRRVYNFQLGHVGAKHL